MNKRSVDKTKKSNIKCEHCEAFDNDKECGGWCSIHQKPKIIGIGARILFGAINTIKPI